MLELEVYPEKSLGNKAFEIVLGMPFLQVVTILKKQFREVKQVEVCYSKEDPLSVDLVLQLPHDGIRLLFDPATQRLKVIDVHDMTKLKLIYNGTFFNSPKEHFTVDQIEECFGATVPGECSMENVYSLNYRGLTFNFPCHPQSKDQYGSSPHSGWQMCTKGTCGVLSQMWIYSGNAGVNKCKAPVLPDISFCGCSHLELLEVLRHDNITKGIKVTLITETEDPRFKNKDVRKKLIEKIVQFGDSCQSVSSALGEPDEIFYKPEDKMKIHSIGTCKKPDADKADYLFNYFTLGLDVLFDACSHQVKKFVLHTNYPGQFNFSIYCRCHFVLPVLVEEKEIQGMEEKEILNIDSYSKWSDIKKPLQVSDVKPVHSTRTPTRPDVNPFGATYFFGVQDIIFEVMENNHICSVTLYQPLPCPAAS